jgi:hypothetical protein
MYNDLESDTLLSLAEAAKKLPGRPAVSTLHRWRLHGIRGVRLVTCMVGGRRFVSTDAIEQFIAETTAAADGQPLPVRTPRHRERAIQQAEAKVLAPSTGRRPAGSKMRPAGG